MCFVKNARSPVSFTWIKDDEELVPSRNVTIKNDEEFSVLIINPVSEFSSGNYTCLVKSAQEKASHRAVLSVIAPVRWVTVPFNLSSSLGQNVSLNCEASGFPSPTVQWRRISKNKRYENSFTSRLQITLIKSSMHTDFGTTFLVATTKHYLIPINDPPVICCRVDMLRHPSRIFVPVIPDKWYTNVCLPHLQITLLKFIHFLCTELLCAFRTTALHFELYVHTDAPTIFFFDNCNKQDTRWIKDSNTVKIKRFKVLNGTLIFQSIKVMDAGEYECSAENSISPPITKRIWIQVNGMMLFSL
ncbi:down syndrome cell adhesion molecule-like protein 1 [Caerostris darwini]|uniref:Down syndrome cell adhesion molecule-like protein 1 n=1 Tax=Caerostris darwini TaxID=1538125 RepID=A0AAV4VB30_9ARAC|nr:down syndrome cell adhesion molecule-like protein 1 [Caerostris darwini]